MNKVNPSIQGAIISYLDVLDLVAARSTNKCWHKKAGEQALKLVGSIFTNLVAPPTVKYDLTNPGHALRLLSYKRIQPEDFTSFLFNQREINIAVYMSWDGQRLMVRQYGQNSLNGPFEMVTVFTAETYALHKVFLQQKDSNDNTLHESGPCSYAPPGAITRLRSDIVIAKKESDKKD